MVRDKGGEAQSGSIWSTGAPSGHAGGRSCTACGIQQSGVCDVDDATEILDTGRDVAEEAGLPRSVKRGSVKCGSVSPPLKMAINHEVAWCVEVGEVPPRKR